MSNPLASPFAEFHVLPCHGRNEAAISWKLEPGLDGFVYFARSSSGLPGTWETLNMEDPAEGTEGTFLDLAAPNADPFSFPKYRGLYDPGGPPDTWIKGPSVSAMDRLTRKEYCIVREIIRREYKHMAGPKGNGVRAFYLRPKDAGTPVTNYDDETGQLLGPDCKDDPNTGYGTPWQGGFHTPLQTWVMPYALDPEDSKSREDLTGEDKTAGVTFRLLAHPKPVVGDLVVFADSDRRYVIDSPIQRFEFRSSVPVFWEAKALLLDRRDPRCRIRMPEIRPDPVWQSEYRRE